jgi:hypothetical protein
MDPKCILTAIKAAPLLDPCKQGTTVRYTRGEEPPRVPRGGGFEEEVEVDLLDFQFGQHKEAFLTR